ncbi:hypothetical protein COHA_008838 [Chlorella ohadii]|uniref:Apple domain-containing protein n=1 Tax=Chlorella ohadii TaxID=2649997 RepID=A0AAD5DJ78_9CHLO|nr:hypothetical protein COHA_008838 [Chlorella ohadii]
MYGRYCGGCDGKVDGEPAKASPIDALDRACFFHDKCYTGDDSCRECYCNALLGDVARQVWEAGKEAEGCGCGLFQRGCSNAVMEAGSVYQWIDKLTYSKNCPDECADAPEVDQCSATVMYETDLYGGDYRDVSISDWHECCNLCASLSDCRAWTYTNGRCYMKDDSWSAEAREGLISGYK